MCIRDSPYGVTKSVAPASLVATFPRAISARSISLPAYSAPTGQAKEQAGSSPASRRSTHRLHCRLLDGAPVVEHENRVAFRNTTLGGIRRVEEDLRDV